MGLRFRKSVKIAPGLKLNFNKNSASITAGTRGAHYTINSKGTKTASVGIPGTGLSYVETSKKTKNKTQEKSSSSSNNSSSKKRGNIGTALLCIFFAGVLLFSCGSDTLNSVTLTAYENTIYDINTSIPIELSTNPNDYDFEDIDWNTNGGKIIESNDSYSFTSDCEGVFSISATIDEVTSNTINLTIESATSDDITDNTSSEPDTSQDSALEQETTDTQVSDSQEAINEQSSDNESANTEPPQETVVEQPSDTISETPQETMVWIPQSGSKYHKKSSCSNMNNPTEVTISEAEARGYTPCKRCY